jgi:hypothetical protein
MVKLVSFFTATCFVCLLSSSSFHLFDYLDHKFTATNYSENAFSFAVKIHHPTALTIEQSKTNLGSDKWLLLNQKLAKNNSKAALRLVSWYQQQLIVSNTQQTNDLIIMWLKHAIRLNSMQAIILLSKLYYTQENYQLAQQVLSEMSNGVEGAEIQYLQLDMLQLKVKIAVALGEIAQVKQLLSNIPPDYLNNKSFTNLLKDIRDYQVIKPITVEYLKNTKLGNVFRGDLNTCLISIQLFATTFAHLLHIDKLLNKFYQQKPLSRYSCFPKPRYINVNMLDCHAKVNQAITCDETIFENIAASIDSRHIGLMMKQGGANVHLGILYFDKHDNVDVLSHEISHLLGFVDEYPLSPKHQVCQEIQRKPFAHNIAVIPTFYEGDRQTIRTEVLSRVAWGSLIAKTTPVLHRVTSNLDIPFDINTMPITWQLGTPKSYQHELGVFPAETCEKAFMAESLSINNTVAFAAYKPLKKHTHLQYFNYNFPTHYENILALDPKAYIMPSFHYNIALAKKQRSDNKRHAEH